MNRFAAFVADCWNILFSRWQKTLPAADFVGVVPVGSPRTPPDRGFPRLGPPVQVAPGFADRFRWLHHEPLSGLSGPGFRSFMVSSSPDVWPSPECAVAAYAALRGGFRPPVQAELDALAQLSGIPAAELASGLASVALEPVAARYSRDLAALRKFGWTLPGNVLGGGAGSSVSTLRYRLFTAGPATDSTALCMNCHEPLGGSDWVLPPGAGPMHLRCQAGGYLNLSDAPAAPAQGEQLG